MFWHCTGGQKGFSCCQHVESSCVICHCAGGPQGCERPHQQAGQPQGFDPNRKCISHTHTRGNQLPAEAQPSDCVLLPSQQYAGQPQYVDRPDQPTLHLDCIWRPQNLPQSPGKRQKKPFGIVFPYFSGKNRTYTDLISLQYRSTAYGVPEFFPNLQGTDAIVGIAFKLFLDKFFPFVGRIVHEQTCSAYHTDPLRMGPQGFSSSAGKGPGSFWALYDSIIV
jgi:hypothetical protein